MTFTVDTCIIVGIVNRFDPHHERSRALLLKREDNLVMLFTVMSEALKTCILKFTSASNDITEILNRISGAPDFVDVFHEEFEKIVSSEAKRSNAHFYQYAYALIEDHLENKDFEQIWRILENHSLDLTWIVPEEVTSLKKVEKTIYQEADTAPDRKRIESVISIMDFPRGADRNNFVVLCVYAKGRELDYFTADGGYYLRMIQALNLIRKAFNTGLSPQHLTDSYIASLQ